MLEVTGLVGKAIDVFVLDKGNGIRDPILDVIGFVGKAVELSVGYGYEGTEGVETGLVGKATDVFVVGNGKGVREAMLDVIGLDELAVG